MGKDNSDILMFGGLAALGILVFSNSSKQTPQPHTTNNNNISPTDFIKKYYPDALKLQAQTGFPVVLTLTQAGVESGWGKFAFGNNFFGIKANKGWTGDIQKLKTWECGKTGNATADGIKDEIIKIFPPGSSGANQSCSTGGKYSYRVYGKFRAYPTPDEGFYDHYKFLKDNSRYQTAMKYLDNQIQFFIELSKAGYATAPNYSDVLIKTAINVQKVISDNKLQNNTPQGSW